MRAGVSFEQVAAAADALVAKGERASQRNIRKHLGTGSPNTIQAHLNAWSRGRVETAQKPKLTLDDDMERAILLGIERRVAAARAELEADLSEAIESRDDITAEAQTLSTQLEEQARELEQKRAEAQQSQGLIQELRSEIEARKAEVRKAQADAKDLIEAAKEEAQKAVARAEAETEQHRAAAEAARTALAKAELRLEAMPRLEAEISRLQAENKTLSDERHEARESAARSEARAEELAIYRGKAEALEKELASTKKALADAEKTAAVETERGRMLERSETAAIKGYEAQLAALKSRIESEESRGKALATKLDETISALGAEQLQTKALRDELARLGKPGARKEAPRKGSHLDQLVLDDSGKPLDKPFFEESEQPQS
jgi:colicin import membrane protein